MSQTALTVVGYVVGTYIGSLYGYPQLGAMVGACTGGHNIKARERSELQGLLAATVDQDQQGEGEQCPSSI